VCEVVSPELPDLVPVEVLLKGSPHRDVDHLLAAADPHHREAPVACLRKQTQLCLVQLAVDRPDLWVRLLAVEGGVDVPTPGEEQTVQVGKQKGAGRKVDRLRTNGFDRTLVGHVVVIAAARTGRDPDARLLFTWHGFADKITSEGGGFVKNVPE